MSASALRRTLAAALAAAILLGAGGAGAQGRGPTATPVDRAIPVSERAATEELTLVPGEQQVLPAEGVRSYSEGIAGVVDVRLTKDASQFVVVGLEPGATTLLFLMSDGSERHYRITVADPGAASPKERERAVPARENIRLDFYFVQLSKSYTHQVGLGWPTSVAPRFSAAFDVKAGALDSATAVIADQALPRLDVAQASGWAKVLRTAAVVTANGERAQMSGGQEINVLVAAALSTGVQKIQAGSIIEVAPLYDPASGRVEVRLHADISELESDRGTGIPGRVISTLDTVVNLELGQSILLSGLTAKSERRTKAGLPGLSQIPLLGVFFGSHAQAEEETENVVFIVPSVVDAVSMQNRERIAEGLRRYVEYSGDLEEVDFVPPPVTRRGRR